MECQRPCDEPNNLVHCKQEKKQDELKKMSFFPKDIEYGEDEMSDDGSRDEVIIYTARGIMTSYCQNPE